MKLRLLNDTDTLKSADNATKLKFAITDNQDTILSLDPYAAITVSIGQNGARYSSEYVEIVDESYAFEFSLTNSLPASIYNVEVTLTTVEGKNHIAPSEGIFKLTIEKSLNEVGDTVTILSVQQLIDDMASTLRVAEEANTKSNNAVSRSESSIEIASKAETIAQKVRSDFDNLTANNTNAELINARTDDTGVVHSALKTRIDAESTKRSNGDASTLQSAKDYTDSKVLSTNDYTKEEKEKLESVELGANKYVAPIATASKHGDVKVGMNISVVEGNISVLNASTTAKGVVQLTDSVTSSSTTTAATANSIKTISDSFNAHKNNVMPHDSELNQYASNVDENGIYTTITFKRSDGTIYMTSIASNADANGNYQTFIWSFYATDGVTLISKKTWTIVYDANNVAVEKVVN